MASYKIDGNDLYTTYGVKVLQARGHLDAPKRKGITEQSFPDSDGVDAFTDSDDIYWEARDIYLDCVLETTSGSNFNTKLTALKTVLEGSGLRSLNLPFPTPTTYSVYMKDGFKMNISTKWRDSKIYGRFTLKLREPYPTMT